MIAPVLGKKNHFNSVGCDWPHLWASSMIGPMSMYTTAWYDQRTGQFDMVAPVLGKKIMLIVLATSLGIQYDRAYVHVYQCCGYGQRTGHLDKIAPVLGEKSYPQCGLWAGHISGHLILQGLCPIVCYCFWYGLQTGHLDLIATVLFDNKVVSQGKCFMPALPNFGVGRNFEIYFPFSLYHPISVLHSSLS